VRKDGTRGITFGERDICAEKKRKRESRGQSAPTERVASLKKEVRYKGKKKTFQTQVGVVIKGASVSVRYLIPGYERPS